MHLISFLMIPNLAICWQYISLAIISFPLALVTCLPQPEAALFPFESSGAAGMSYILARVTNPLWGFLRVLLNRVLHLNTKFYTREGPDMTFKIY